MAEPMRDGRGSSRRSSRSWHGSTEPPASPDCLVFFEGGSIELEQLDPAAASLAVDRLYIGCDGQHHCDVTEGARALDRFAGAVSAHPAADHGPLHVCAAVCGGARATMTKATAAMKTTNKSKSGSPDAAAGDASRLIDARIKELGDWRGKTLGRLRALIKEA